ncbi:MFS transporter, partial [Paraburkholderia sp. SIMBA_009]
MSNPPPSPSSNSAAPEFSGAALLCVLAMLNHVALTGGRITVSLTAL